MAIGTTKQGLSSKVETADFADITPADAAVNAVATSTATPLAVAPKRSMHLSVKAKVDMLKGTTNPLLALERLIPVDYSSLPSLKYKDGAFVDNGKKLGDRIVVSLLSYQPEFVIDLGASDDDTEAKKLTRWSKDGVSIDNGDGTGTLIGDYIEEMKTLGYADAKLKTRSTLVVMLIDCDKSKDLIGELFTIPLAPTAKAAFDSFGTKLGIQMAMGRLNDDVDVTSLVLEVVPQTGKDNKSFNNIKFLLA